MIPLQSEFDAAFDGSPVHHFKQVRRDGDVVIYHRTQKDGKNVGCEVFRVKSQTFPLAGGGRSEPRESYPRAERFGKDAYFCLDMERAEVRFLQLQEISA